MWLLEIKFKITKKKKKYTNNMLSKHQIILFIIIIIIKLTHLATFITIQLSEKENYASNMYKMLPDLFN